MSTHGGAESGRRRGWLARWRERRACFHHDIGGNPANSKPAVSWIEQRLIDTGRRKMFWCTHCDRTWFA